MQITVELGANVSSTTIETINAVVEVGGNSRSSELAPAALLREGKAAFVVIVGDAGKAGFEAAVSVSALDGGGRLVAEGGATFPASGDGCNDFTLMLRPPNIVPIADGATNPCATDSLTSGKSCNWSAPAGFEQAFWDSNTGSATDRRSCEVACTSWGIYTGATSWCCELVDASGAGTGWVCRVYPTAATKNDNTHFFAALGRCR